MRQLKQLYRRLLFSSI